MRNYHRQHGGTLLGLILGLVIGLAIALGVAVVITKTPMPFNNKVGKPGKGAAASLEDFDPNKPLYGKFLPKEPATLPAQSGTAGVEASKNTDARSDLLALVSMASSSLGGAEAKPVDPRIDDSRSALASAPAPEEKWSYYLQAGAFRRQTDAENTRAKLALLGVEARVTERASENGSLYRVRIGPFAQMESLNRVRGKLSDSGVDAAVVRVAQ